VRRASTVPQVEREPTTLLWGIVMYWHPSIIDNHIRTKGNEFILEVRITLSSCFHKDLVAVAHDIQQQGDSFTPTGDNSHEILETLSVTLEVRTPRKRPNSTTQ